MTCNSSKSDHWLEQLKCNKCHNYLSHHPIYLTADNENICGRCPIPNGKSYVRNHVYEVASKEIPFPCQYQNQGCLEKISPKNLPQHEPDCPYKTVICPTAKFTKCTKKLSCNNLEKHYEDEHSNIILKSGEFNITILNSSQRFDILRHNNTFIFVLSLLDLDNKILEMAIGDEGTVICDFFPLEISLTCGDRNLSITSLKGYCKIYIDSITRSNDCSTIGVKFLRRLEKNVPENNIFENFNKELLEVMKCPLCSEYLMPPFSFFKNRMLCSNCNESEQQKLNNPNDQDNRQQFYQTYVSSPRNHMVVRTDISGLSLSKLTALVNLLNYPCKNVGNGCTFTSRPNEIMNHQTCCSFDYKKCPVNESGQCKWNGLEKDMEDHILNQHNNMIVTNPETTERIYGHLENNFPYTVSRLLRNLNRENHQKIYILRFSHYFFKFIFFESNNQYYWTMQMIGKFQNIFKFEVEIIDINNSCNKLITTQACTPLSLTTGKDIFQNVDDYCYFHYDQIRKFVSENRITFKVRIFK